MSKKKFNKEQNKSGLPRFPGVSVINKNHALAAAFIVTAATFITFLPSLKNNFTTLDDDVMVTENLKIRDLSWQGVKTMFTEFHYKLYHPVVLLSYAIEYRYSRLNPKIYHATNLVFHVINSLFVFWLFFLLTGNMLVASFVSLLFGIHPLHVESVAWVAERKDMLYSFFFLAGLISYIYYLREKKLKTYIFSVIMLVLSFFSKPMAISFPFILLLTDYFVYGRLDKKNLAEKIPFFAVSVFFGVMTLLAPFPYEGVKQVQSAGFLYNVLTASYGLLFYVLKMVFPFKLSCVYPDPWKMGGVYGYMFYISPVLLLLAAFLVYRSARSGRKIIFGAVFYFITVFPVLQLIPTASLSKTADRYAYIPLLGIFYLLAEGFAYIYNSSSSGTRKMRGFLSAFAIFVLLFYSYTANNRCLAWKDGKTLWNDVLKNYSSVNNVAAIAYSSRAISLIDEKDYDNAILDCTKAIELDPKHDKSYINRGIAYGYKKDYYKAIIDFSKALELDPVSPKSYNDRGIAYARTGDYERAISDYGRALEIDSNMPDVYLNRGISYTAKGEKEKALQDYSRILSVDPGYVKAYNMRGSLYMNTGNYELASADFQKAMSIAPSSTDAYINYGNLLFFRGDYDRAINYYDIAIKLNPAYLDPYYNRAVSYFKKKDYEKARADIALLLKAGYNVNPQILKELNK